MSKVRVRKLSAWFAGLLGLYAVVGFFVVPAVLKRQAIVYVERELHHTLEVGDIRFNPFTLTLEMRDLALKETSGADLVGFRRFFVNFQSSSLFRRAWTFAAVELDAPALHFESRPEGRHNFSELLARLRKPTTTQDDAIPRLTVDSIRVTDGRLRIADLQAGPDARISLYPIAFELTSLSTLPSATSPYQLTARSLNGETIQWSGAITLNPFSSSGKIAFKGWKFATFDRLLGTRIGVQSALGQIDIALDYSAGLEQGKPVAAVSNGHLLIDGLALTVAEGTSPLIGLKHFEASGGAFDLAQRTASFERVDIEEGRLDLSIDTQGRGNWAALALSSPGIAADPATRDAEPATPPDSTAPEPASPPWKLSIGRLIAADVAAKITDTQSDGPRTLAFEGGRFETASTLTVSREGITAILEGVSGTASAVAANLPNDNLTMQTVQMSLATLKLEAAANGTRAAMDGIKLTLSKPSMASNKQSLRADGLDLAVPDMQIVIAAASNSLPAVSIARPTFELRGLGVRTSGPRDLVELSAMTVGAERISVGGNEVLHADADGVRTTLSTLRVREADGAADAARVGTLEAGGGTISTTKRSVSIERIIARDAYASAAYSADGRLNWNRLLATLLPPAPAPKSKAAVITGKEKALPAWNVVAKLIEIDKSAAAYVDARETPPLAVGIQDLRARVRNVGTATTAPANVEASGRVKDGGQFRFAGNVDINRVAADVKVKLEGIPLVPVQPFLAKYARLKLASGLASAEGRLRYGLPKSAGAQLVYEGTVGLDQLDIQEADPVQPFFALGSMRALQTKLTLAPNALDVPDLRLRRLATKLLIAEDQSVNLTKVLRTPADPGKGDSPPAGQADSDKAASGTAPPDEPFPVTIGRIRIDDSQLEFADLSLRPQLFRTRMHELKGVITGVSTSRDSRARLELDARIDEFGLALIRGSINPFRPRAYTEVDLDFRNIPMTKLTPYSSKFAGYRIASGQLTTNLQYRVKNSALQGNNKIVLDNLELGEKVESPSAMDVPLEFAIAILKDSNGRIDIGLPVTGSLDDPQFSIAGLVWKAIGNLLTNIVTAPFRALAGLFGSAEGDQLGAVEFDAGSADLRPPERQKLRTIGEALQKRPQLKLTVKPTVATAADREAIQSLNVRRAVLARAGIKLEASESPGPLDVGNPRMQQAIEALFVDRFGLPVARDLRASLAKPATATNEAASASGSTSPPPPPSTTRQASRIARTMADRLIEATEIGDAELTELGRRRAAAIVSELGTTTKIDASRLASEAPQAKDAKDGQIVSELELSVAK